MKTMIRAAVLILAWAITGDLGVEAQADSFPTVAYRLVEGSTFQEGCFDPCECFLIEEQPMIGTFDMVFYPFAGPLWRVAVERLAFSVPTLAKQISGQGSYVRAGEMQELRLDLQIDGEPAQTFDSGWITGGDAYPFMDVTVSMNGLYCYDIALHLRAVPVNAAPHLTLEGPQLAWSAMPDASVYDVVYGDLAALRVNDGYFGVAVDACLGDDLLDTTLTEELKVGGGQAVWFLVRPQGGSYDSGGAQQAAPRDAGIADSIFACP